MGPRIVIFDLETTGIDAWNDRIVEIFATDGEKSLHRYVNPEREIPPEATAVHGIATSHVAQVPTFRQLAPSFASFFQDAILVGYNSKRYDTIMLHEEFFRAGIAPPFTLDNVPEIDVLAVWRSVETQNLTSAVKRWLGKKDWNAHSAKEDALAALRVLLAICREYELSREDCLRITQKAQRQACFQLIEGDWVFSFGMHRGKLAKTEPDYLRWMLANGFDPESKKIARSLLEDGA